MNLNATILGQTISFILFVWFCMKYIWPPIILAIETRQKEIQESLTNAQKAKEELNIIQKKMQIEIQEAKAKASTIINEAHKQKLLILEQARETASKETKKILMNAQSEIDIKITHARNNLRREIVDLSIAIAEKIIKKNISKDQDKDLLDKLIVSLAQEENSCL